VRGDLEIFIEARKGNRKDFGGKGWMGADCGTDYERGEE